MSGSDIFSIVGSALDAQNARMGAIASNLANVDSITTPGGTPYLAHEVVFAAAPVAGSSDAPGIQDASFDIPTIPGDTASNDAGIDAGQDGVQDMGVSVAGTVLSDAAPKQTYDPSSPYANAQGYVTGSNVSQVDQMVDLIDSSNTYSASVAVLQEAGRVDQQMLSSFQVS
jgi:flagellar basal-body rod protein FlgC